MTNKVMELTRDSLIELLIEGWRNHYAVCDNDYLATEYEQEFDDDVAIKVVDRLQGDVMTKQEIASKLKSLISHFADLTAQEQALQQIDPEADATWNEIVELINKLTGE